MNYQNNFIYSDSEKRYHAYDYYLTKKYGAKTAKIALDAGFACPHIIQTGRGCVYCGENSRSGKNILLTPEEIIKQFHEKKAALSKKWPRAKYIAYFQAGTNTFAPLEELKKIYESVLEIPDLAGIDIATRPDCITREIAEYLGALNLKTDVTIELGLQTCHAKTAELINRGYKPEAFEAAYKLIAGYKIPAALHIINGLPGETPDMMLETVKYIANLNPLPAGVKIHMLYIEPGTELYDLYNAGGLKLLTKEEYTDITASQLEYLPPQIAIMRLTGDPDAALAPVVPAWAQKKFAVLNGINKLLEQRGTYQGSRIKKQAPPEAKKRAEASLTNILSAAKRLLDVAIEQNQDRDSPRGGVYADFTMGNGNDVLYIKKKRPASKIYAFDIQKEALEATKNRLLNENCFDENIYLIHDSHANFKKYIPEQTQLDGLDGAVFNLGYLPGGDKSITTRSESTLACLEGALGILKPGGVITVCVYPGHGEGAREGEKILELAAGLDKKQYDCLYHRLINVPEAPYIIAFQKKPQKKPPE